MILPPVLIKIRVVKQSCRKFSIWLPVFFLWPLLLVLILVSIPFLLVFTIAYWNNPKARKSIRNYFSAIAMFFLLRGLEVNIKNNEEEVFIQLT